MWILILYVAKNAFIETEVLSIKSTKPYKNVGYINLYIVDEKIFLTKLGMCVVSVEPNDLHAIWWSDLKTSFIETEVLSIKGTKPYKNVGYIKSLHSG